MPNDPVPLPDQVVQLDRVLTPEEQLAKRITDLEDHLKHAQTQIVRLTKRVADLETEMHHGRRSA